MAKRQAKQRYVVARTEELPPGQRRIVTVRGREIGACVPLTLQSDLSRMRLRGEKPRTKVSGLPVAQPGFFFKKSRIELAMACHIRLRR